MSQNYTELGYDENNLKEIKTGDTEKTVTSPLEADSLYGDGSMPGGKIQSGPNLSTFGFPDNFDSSYPFVLPYYIDSSARVTRATISLFFQPYRSYSTTTAAESSHTHSVTIGNHTHSVTLSDHTHGVSSGDHTHSVTGATSSSEGTGESAHQHTIKVKATSSTNATLDALGYRYIMVQPSGGGDAGPCDDGSDIGLLWGANSSGDSGSDNDISFKTNCTISGHNHTITGQTASSGGGFSVTSGGGGGTTATSSSGGSTTVASAAGSSHTHAMAYAIYSSGYPTDVSITIDGVDVTSALGGPWNPTAGTHDFVDLDITNYTSSSGTHTIQLTTTGQGRCIPLLVIKSVLGSKS